MTTDQLEPTTMTASPSNRADPANGIVTVVIPAYQGGEELAACIRSLLASTCTDLKILIVDNASTDGSIENVETLFPSIEVLRNPVNVGFGAACNRGIDVAIQRHATYALLINQDTTVSPKMIDELIAFADLTPQAAVVGPKTLSSQPMPNGLPRLLYAGAWRTSLPLWQRIPGIGLADSDQHQSPILVDYVWGHGMLLRVAALRTVGTFDPGFFMYYEDLDLCARMTEAGWQAWSLPDAMMWHNVDDGARASNSEAWRWKRKVESMLHFYQKRSSFPTALFLTCATIGREAISLARHRHARSLWHLFSAAIQLGLGGFTKASDRNAPRSKSGIH